MTTTRPIAILRADTMVGQDFLLPNTIRRVIGRPFPKAEHVYDLARAGGFTVSFGDITLYSDEPIADVLTRTFGMMLTLRPVFVDLDTGHVFVSHNVEGRAIFVAPDGNLIDAFGTRPQSDAQQNSRSVQFEPGIANAQACAIRAGIKSLALEEIIEMLEGEAVFTMTTGELVRTLVDAIAASAALHRAITTGQRTDEAGPTFASDIIPRIRFV